MTRPDEELSESDQCTLRFLCDSEPHHVAQSLPSTLLLALNLSLRGSQGIDHAPPVRTAWYTWEAFESLTTDNRLCSPTNDLVDAAMLKLHSNVALNEAS